jgi:hypothetical protein
MRVRARRGWLIPYAVAILGSVAFWMWADQGGRSATSYLAGLAAATAIFQVSVAAVRRASDASPSFGVVVAMTTYLTVVVLMAAIAALLSPQLVDGDACAAGLVVAAVLGVAQQYRAARPDASN